MFNWLKEVFASKQAENPKVMLKDRPLFSMRSQEPSNDGDHCTMTFADGTLSCLITGATGEGKTVSVMRPALYQLIQAKCPGLVLDVKGDYIEFCRTHVPPDRLHIIGPYPGGTPFNLIKGMELESFRSLLGSLMDDDGAWGKSALRDACLIFVCLKLTEAHDPTITEVIQYLQEPDSSLSLLSRVHRSCSHVSSNFENLLRSCQSDEFSVFNNKPPEDISSKADEQRSWQLNHLVQNIRPLIENEEIIEAFSGKEGISFKDLIYSQRKVVVLYLPQTRYGQSAFSIAGMIRQRFADAVFSYDHRLRQKKGFGRKAFSFLMIDEYQNFARLNSKQAAEGVIDDNTWIDKSRQYANINLFATQGIASLLAQGDSPAVYSFLQNCRNKIFLGSDDEATLDKVSQLTGQPEETRSYLLHDSQIGNCVMYLPRSTRAKQVSTTAFGRTGQHQQLDCMNRFIHDSDDYSMKVVNHAGKLIPNKKFQPFVRKRDLSEQDIDVINIILPKHAIVDEDILSGYREGVDRIVSGLSGLMDTLHNMDSPSDLINSSSMKKHIPQLNFIRLNATSKNAVVAELADLMNQYADTLNEKKALRESEALISLGEGDYYDSETERTHGKEIFESNIFCIARGGGSEEDLAIYNDKALIDAAMRLREASDGLYTGIGHSVNTSLLDNVADKALETPSMLGIHLAKQLNHKKILEIFDEAVALDKKKEDALDDASTQDEDVIGTSTFNFNLSEAEETVKKLRPRKRRPTRNGIVIT